MVNSLVFSGDLYERLRAHVEQPDLEQVAFMFTEEMDGDAADLQVVDLLPAEPSWFELQSGYHVGLKDEVRGLVIKQAWERGAGLAEAHSHVGGFAAGFSPTDVAGLEDWAPHVRWRLGGRPYVALVFGNASFDALVWAGDDTEPTGLGAVRVDDGRRFGPTGRTLEILGRHHG